MTSEQLRRAHPNPDVAEVIVYNNGGRCPAPYVPLPVKVPQIGPAKVRPAPRGLPNPPSTVLDKAPASRPLEPCR